MSYNNSNRKNIREAEKAAKLAETNRIAYTRTIMSDMFGRAWMHDLLVSCNVFHTPFVATMPDMTSFNCGKQSLGLRIFGDVAAHCPNEYTLMMIEASTKEEAHVSRYQSFSDTGRDGTSASSGRNPDQPSTSAYGLDADGFVTDQSGTVEGDAEGSAEERSPA